MKQREIVICSTPRSGSTLLSEAMFRTRLLGTPDEYLNNDERNKGDIGETILQREWRVLGAESFADYCEKLRARYQSENGVHSVKIHFEQFIGALTRGYFRRPVERKFVYIYRRDFRAQAASLAIAMVTQQWNSNMTARVQADSNSIGDNVLAECYRAVINNDNRWRSFFNIFNMEPLIVEYEEVASNVAGVVQKVARLIGEDIPEDVLASIGSQGSLKKQSWSLNEQLKERLSEKMTLEEFGPGNILFDTKALL